MVALRSRKFKHCRQKANACAIRRLTRFHAGQGTGGGPPRLLSAAGAGVPEGVAGGIAGRRVLCQDVRGDAADVGGDADRHLNGVVGDVQVDQTLLIASALSDAPVVFAL